MRFMIIVRANARSESGVMPPPDDPLFADMHAYHEELARAGVLLDGNGLKPSSRGWRIRYQDDQRSLRDGPFAETKELIAGYTLIQVRSREEAMEWARRFPAPFGKTGDGGEIEVRELYEPEDFEQPR
ncbi:YciI family protein [Paucibacter sp. APW11]|uniref:YciI family protein n=1 Tax=Roseateles aquae TaxID=3077235 RepID=A0ABU3PJ15_9BURK|nr:YciI family protein [Paucibacter sp. APW11]MDT9002459.1 YciI family protein [Paucibacter sp. APW11]